MNKYVAAALAIVLGSFGAHKFYMGKPGKGILYALFCWTCIPGIIGLIEGISYFLKSQEDFERCYSQKVGPNFDGKFMLKGVNGQLYVYDNKVVISRKGVLSKMTHGFAGVKTIPMNSINSVQFKKGGMALNGFLQFAVQGGIERQGGVLGSVDDENSVTFSASSNNVAHEIYDFINDKIINRGTGGGQTVIQQASSAADEIAKMKDLLDKGIITQEEFDNKKAQILK